MSNIILTVKETEGRVNLNYQTFKRLEERGEFPKHVIISPGKYGYVESEIEEWSLGLIAKRDFRDSDIRWAGCSDDCFSNFLLPSRDRNNESEVIYCIHSANDCGDPALEGSYVFVNRLYNPIGYHNNVPGVWVNYSTYHERYLLPGLTPEIAQELSCTGRDDLDRIWLYKTGDMPWIPGSPENKRFIRRMKLLASLKPQLIVS